MFYFSVMGSKYVRKFENILFQAVEWVYFLKLRFTHSKLLINVKKAFIGVTNDEIRRDASIP